MEIEIEMNFFWIALALFFLGYFINDGLRNFKNPKKGSKYQYFINERDLHLLF
ncbi:hypothetical protein J2S17_003559 [Cytobacillus purgationiresistens]|uniref:Phage protein n=1 Tax=Cytobacillus purgationiresistens TaxID=863449 RepID=A0ABU0ALR1_9BACI|nr:hypothetical protein [Cytobacillus purgationiresistens]